VATSFVPHVASGAFKKRSSVADPTKRKLLTSPTYANKKRLATYRSPGAAQGTLGGTAHRSAVSSPKYNKVAEIKDASRYREEFMRSLSRSAKSILQVLRYTLRYAVRSTPMSFEDFLSKHRLSLLGIYLMEKSGARDASITQPYPSACLEEDELETLIDDLERSMPYDNMIADLRDWDLRLYDLLADDWFFGAAFGPESLVDSYASDLAEVFMEQVEQLGLEYDQQSDPDSFDALVDEEALKFISAWRTRIYSAHHPDTRSAA
jgi:hypothetical protein